jgi:lysophospholipase
MGAAGTAVNFWYIEDVSNGSLATFTKRGIDASARPLVRRQQSSGSSPEAGFPIQFLEELIDAFNESFHLPLDQLAYAWYPNPFAGLPSVSSELRGPSLKLVDASENGQAIPLWTQIQPARGSNFIIAWDDAGDAKPYAWNNGTNLYDTYVRANEAGIPFPVVPSASTFIARNYTTQPVFFGCDASLTTTKDARSPIVAYFANAPYSAYTNISYFQTNTSMAQVGEMWVNSFNQMTQGNGTLDTEWPVCLGCAAIERSLAKVGLQTTEQCQRCFDKYCWDGTSVEEYPGTETVGPSLVLDPSLGFLKWVKTNPYGT